MSPKGRAVVGYRVSKQNFTPAHIPLKTQQAGTSLLLFVAYTLDLQTEKGSLTVRNSAFRLQKSDEDGGQAAHDSSPSGGGKGVGAALRYDYVRDPTHRYPEAHLQIDGECAVLADLVQMSGKPDRPSSKLHLPVGGRRFRPCLEDIIEFCLEEGIVVPTNPDWKKVVGDQREGFYRRQLKAAVRQSPLVAASALRDLGSTVSEPES